MTDVQILAKIALTATIGRVSMGGMAFLYLTARPLTLADSQMDILAIYLEEVLQIFGLPVTVAADQKLEMYSNFKRRCGIRFGELTQDQRVQLQAFINRHTANPG